jgi:hypothetical protein
MYISFYLLRPDRRAMHADIDAYSSEANAGHCSQQTMIIRRDWSRRQVWDFE